MLYVCTDKLNLGWLETDSPQPSQRMTGNGNCALAPILGPSDSFDFQAFIVFSNAAILMVAKLEEVSAAPISFRSPLDVTWLRSSRSPAVSSA